jgi:hypothetical protein
LRTRLTQVLIKQILKDRTGTLEAIRSDVGEIVGDDIELGLLGVEAGSGYPQ